MYKIDNHIPAPVADGRGRGKSQERLAIESLEPGQSVFIPFDTGSLKVMVHDVKAQSGFHLTTRRMTEYYNGSPIAGRRIWRVA